MNGKETRIMWEKITPLTRVWCKTEKEARQLLDEANKHGCQWITGDSLVGETNWGRNKAETVYVGLSGGNVVYGCKKGLSDIPFSDLVEYVDKPIGQLTLREVREECASHSGCMGCRLENSEFCNNYKDVPAEWNLTDTPRLTEGEVELLRHVYKTCGNASVVCEEEGQVSLRCCSRIDRLAWDLPPELFPSIRRGQEIDAKTAIDE